MKKTFYLFLTFILILALTACGSTKTPNNNITYTEEFDYIPKHEAMALDSYAEAEAADQFSDALYKLNGVNFDTFLEEYQTILEKDGWEITEDKKPISISAQKGERIAVFLLSESDGGILMMVLAR